MEVIALKSFISTTYGNVSEGQKLTISDSISRNWIKSGMVKCYETKVVVQTPVIPEPVQEQVVVPVVQEPTPSSPPVQVSKKKTAKKRGKKRK